MNERRRYETGSFIRLVLSEGGPEVTGVIVGRTYEERERYDVRVTAGGETRVYTGVEYDRLKPERQ